MKQEYHDDCPYYLEDFLTHLKIVKDRADRTEEAYYIDIRTFLRYLNIKHGSAGSDQEWNCIKISETPIEWIESFTLNDAYTYLKYLKDVRSNSAKTRARKTSALRQFYNYLYSKAKLINSDPIDELETPKPRQTLPKYLTLNQSLQLLQNIESNHTQRDYCIITLFLNCGMRLSELVALNLSDYSKENQTLKLFGKGSKERIVSLNPACISALDNYISVRPDTDEEAIFLSANKKRISKRRVQQIVEEMLERAGLSELGITTHKLRHTAATLMYQHGNVDTLVLKDILGHESIATTEIYTHLADEQLKEAADANPLSKIKKNK
ncbi:MAG: tyrosine recombinase XerC [Ruminococcus sp.]|nr:tyrosine recombinase XerC [Ruminococcus sp.]